jgi:hypothetical protein
MSTLTLRTVKGFPLTNAEVDANFTNILVALGGTNSAPYTLPTAPSGGGTIVLSNSPTFTGTVSMGDGASAARFPNAGAIVSDVTTNQINSPHNIGLLGETKATTTTSTATGTSGANTISISAANAEIAVGQGVTGSGIAPDATVTGISGTTITLSANNTGAVTGTTTFAEYGYGLYGSGYTSGVALSAGMAGVGRVSSSLDTGNAIGISGTALDVHVGGSNIGLYADAYGGATNYALYVNRGAIYSPSTLNISAPSLGLPTGTTGTRPGTAAAGNLRFNTDLAVFEGYNGAKWGSIGGGGLTATAIQTTNGYTAAANDLVRCNTTAGAFSITLPASPTDGDIVGIVDTHETFNTYNLTVLAAGSKTIEGDTTSLILDMNGTYISLVFNSTGSGTGNWRILETPTGVGTFTTPVKVASYTASVGDLVRCDTTLGSFTVTLPTSPADGSIVNIVDVAGTFYTYNLNVARGGSNTVEGDTLVYLDINGTYASFVYNATGTNWKLLQTPYGVLGNVTSAVTLAGITKGTGKDLTTAVAGTDYQSPIGTISGLVKGNGANLLTAATAGTDYLAPPSGTSLLKANSGGALSNAVAGTDYLAAVTPGTSGNVLTSNGTTWTSAAVPASAGTFTAVASGTLANGDVVYLKSDGTVASTISGSSSIGTATALSSNVFAGYTSSAYDPINQKVVICYTNGIAGTGYATVGTVSGTSISFGTPVQFDAGTVTYISITYDITNQKFVICYAISSAYAIVGTVSGTSISFGTRVTVNAGASTYISSTYDSINQKVVICYVSNGGYAIVGTVSGTSISFGTAVQFQTGAVTITSPVYDSINQKVVICYLGAGSAKAIVGTVSGTSISFGTADYFANSPGSAVQFLAASYNLIHKKVICVWAANEQNNVSIGNINENGIDFSTTSVFYRGLLTSTFGSYSINIVSMPTGNIGILFFGNSTYTRKLVIGVLTLNGVVFSTPININTSIDDAYSYSSTIYDSTNQRIVISFNDHQVAGYGLKSIVIKPSDFSLDNVIGISTAAYTNSQTATISTTGSVVTNQTSLTTAKKYFVNELTGVLQSNYSSLYIGTALSSTKLLVQI